MKPPESAEKSLGEIVGEVSQKASLLVREEIELAKAEVTTKVTRIGKGVAAFGAAAFIALLGLIFVFHTLAWGIADWFSFKIWVGYGITTILLFVFAGIAAMLGLRFVKRGSPPVPEMAIEEAKKTRESLEEVRH
ncbi:MAG: phage holin family protein [Thermoleophilaceae bacterium]|jgi:protein-S-isoprenylcysteine O-methyltransferase Ste14